MGINEGEAIKCKTLPDIDEDLTLAKIFVQDLRRQLNNTPGRSRERSLAITKLEEAEIWLDKASYAETDPA